MDMIFFDLQTLGALASIAGLLPSFGAWFASEYRARRGKKKEEAKEIIEQYVEWLRRRQHNELLDRLSSSQQALSELHDLVEQLMARSKAEREVVLAHLKSMDKRIDENMGEIKSMVKDIPDRVRESLKKGEEIQKNRYSTIIIGHVDFTNFRPEYEWQLQHALANFLGVKPSDVKIVDAAAGNSTRITVETSRYLAQLLKGASEKGDPLLVEALKSVGRIWPEVSVPFGGPKVSELFAGREEELKELKKALRGKKTIVAVVGMAGRGKSCLVGELFKRGARPAEGIGLFWRRVYEAGYSFDKFVSDLHLYLTGREIDARAVPTVEGRAALAVGALKERPCWIVLDGVERWLKRWAAAPDAGVENLTVDDRAGQDEALDKFLKAAAFWDNGSRLVLTTRAAPSALDENPPVMIGQAHGNEKRLADLKEGEAVELLRKLGVQGDERKMREAVKAHGCHAYAVHVLGRLIFERYGGDVSRWEEASPFEEKKEGRDFGGLFARIIENREGDRGLLELLACSVGPGPVEMVSELLGEGDKAVRRRLAELERWEMVEFGGRGAEEHTVVRQYLLGRMGIEKAREVRKAIAGWWAGREVAINPTRHEEIEPLLKAVEHLLAAGEPLDAMHIFFTKPSQESYYSPGEWLWKFGYLDEDIRILGDAVRVYENVIEKEGRVELRGDLAMCYNNRGLALRGQGKLDEAIEDYGGAIGIIEELIEREGRVELRNDLAMCYNNRGNALGGQGKLDEAIEDYGRAIGIREGLVEEGRVELRNDLAGCYNNRGNALGGQGKLDEAIEDFGRAIGIREELIEKEGRVELRNDLAGCYNNRGNALGGQGKLDEAIEDYGRAIGIREELIEKEGRVELRGGLGSCLFNRAIARRQKRDWKSASEDIQRGGALLRGLIGEGQRHVIESFMKTAGYRCSFAEELGGVKEAAEWANDAMRWFVEEAEAGEMNEVLNKEGREFAGTVLGKREELIKGGLDEGVLGRFLEVLKEAGG